MMENRPRKEVRIMTTLVTLKDRDASEAASPEPSTVAAQPLGTTVTIDDLTAEKLLSLASNGPVGIVHADALARSGTSFDFETLLDRYADNDLTIFSARIGSDHYVFPELSASNILSFLHEETRWPIACMTISPQVAHAAAASGNAGRALLATVIAIAIAEGRNIILGVEELALESESALQISRPDLCKVLRFLAETIAIEELFPTHPWADYPEESAAACYHQLAASFLKYGDIEAANDCVSFGEQLEDSPRGLALRGMIAFQQGETLAAVANLVSSLQEYERRKKSKQHYLIFEPKDLEVVNSSLQFGLEALNKRNNSQAASHFARAIQEFDALFDFDWTENIAAARASETLTN